MLDPVAPEALNRRLAGQMFIRGRADENFYASLVREIRGLERPTDKSFEENVHAAGAWDRAFARYEALKRRRDEMPTVSPEVMAEANRRHAVQRERNDFVWARGHLEDAKKRVPNWHLFAEFAGLRDCDLDPPIDDRWGPIDRARYSRISRALRWIETATPEDWGRLPRRMQARRAEQAAREQLERTKKLEDELAELKAELAAAKSQSRAARELVEDADVLIDFRKISR